MDQLSLVLEARAVGERMANLCTYKAEREGFDAEGARTFILGWLARHGKMRGEQLTDAAIEHGFHAHDARAYGSVFSTLSRRGLIRCVGYCERVKGHGTAGGRLWEAAR